MRIFKLVSWIVVLLIAAGLLTLVLVQNREHTVRLSLDLYFWAWRFSKPVQVVPLILGALGLGLLGGGVVGYLRGRADRQRPSSQPVPDSTVEAW